MPFPLREEIKITLSPALKSMLSVHTLHLRMSNAYLIENQVGLFLVDAGMPGDERHIITRIKTLGYNSLRLIFLTHAHIDHFGSAFAMSQLTGAPIAIHHADAGALANGKTHLGEVRGRGRLIRQVLPILERFLRFEARPPDIMLEDDSELEKYGLYASVVHTPGHTPGSITLFLENRYAFVGDLISTNGAPHVQRYYASDWSQIPTSLTRLQSLKPDVIYPGHGHQPLNREGLDVLCSNI